MSLCSLPKNVQGSYHKNKRSISILEFMHCLQSLHMTLNAVSVFTELWPFVLLHNFSNMTKESSHSNWLTTRVTIFLIACLV